MTTSTLASPPRPSRGTATRHLAGRRATVIVLICALISTAIMREWATDRQETVNNVRASAASRSSLGNMDSFALALLLGGLRGPLVMFLWPAIENQKADHNLEDIDTMIEWVRLLQPEFVSVHMFQIWNKAYNISAMMSSSATKYIVVMDALDYGYRVDQQRPGDINILRSIQDVYGGKLGATNLPEFPFYTKQFREDSLPKARRDLRFPEDKGKPRLAMWKDPKKRDEELPLLTDTDEIRPDLVEPTRDRAIALLQAWTLELVGWPSDKPALSEWNDGSELQYLKPFKKFPYGISPLAMSYNYAKRTQVALTTEGQRPLQTTGMVLDSQPALSLRFWSEDEARYGRLYEARAFGIVQNDNMDQGLLRIKPATPVVDKDAIEAAMYFYDSTRLLSEKAIEEYQRHLHTPYGSWRIETYRSHLEEMQANAELAAGDLDYLKAVVTTQRTDYRALLDSAAQHYEHALVEYERIVLRYYMEDGALWPSSMTSTRVMPPHVPAHERTAVTKLTDAEVKGSPGVPGVFDKAMKSAANLRLDQRDHDSERAGYQVRVDRCKTRINMINPSGAPLRRPLEIP